MHTAGAEREQADAEMMTIFQSITEEEKLLLQEAVNEDFAGIRKKVNACKEEAMRINVRKQMESILPFISVSEFSKKYFGRSASWLHQRINGNIIHGKQATFTEKELHILSESLNDLSNHLSNVSAAIHHR